MLMTESDKTPLVPDQGFLITDLPAWAQDPKKLPVNFEPTQDLVVVLPDALRQSTGGLMKAESVRGQIEPMGTVIARGPGKFSDFTGTLIPNDWVKIGSRYTYSKHAGDDMLLDEFGVVTPYLGFVPDNHILVKIMRAGALLTSVTE